MAKRKYKADEIVTVLRQVGVCGEFQFTRQLASEISHRGAVASDMSRGGWSEANVHRSSEPA